MRTVTLDGLGAVAPVIPGPPPQLYGMGTTDSATAPAQSMTMKHVAIGGVSFLVGVLVGHFVWKK